MKAKIVIVDDVQATREESRAALEGEFEISGEASDGAEAVDLCSRVLPDVVLMDIVMPRMSGIEATRRLLLGWDPAHKVPKIVIMSGLTDENVVMQALEAGASDYLIKPVAPEKLLEVIRGFLRSAA